MLSQRGYILPLILFGVVAVLSGIGLLMYLQFYKTAQPQSNQPLPTANLTSEITDFESCMKAGYPVQESYPRRCVIPNGMSFTEVINQEASSAAILVKEGWTLFRGNASAIQNPDAVFTVQYPSNWELDESIVGVGVVYPLGKGDDKPRIVLGAGGHGWYPEISSTTKEYSYGTVQYSWGKPDNLDYFVGIISFNKKYSFILEASYIPAESENEYRKIFEEMGETLQVQ